MDLFFNGVIDSLNTKNTALAVDGNQIVAIGSDAEILNLENGESDLFKINVQQEKLIVSQTKLLKLKAEYEKLKATLYWAAGVRNLAITP